MEPDPIRRAFEAWYARPTVQATSHRAVAASAFTAGAKWAAHFITSEAFALAQPSAKIDFGELDDFICKHFGVEG